MKLYLAPMEGVMDASFREIITGLGGVDQATTEFLRVNDRPLSSQVLLRDFPELRQESKTLSQVPVFGQLLGSDTSAMAETAAALSDLGACGIDLNFGCPAKTVNRNHGGATLLQFPEKIFEIVKAVRQAVPPETTITTKIRLGYESTALCLENAKACEEGGSTRLTVHARLKTEGYRPPAHWHWIPQIQRHLRIPVVANGDIWNLEDLKKCQAETGVSHFMVGRGALRNPYLFQELREIKTETTWMEVKPLVQAFFEINLRAVSGPFAVSRTKQWLSQLSIKFPQAGEMFQTLKISRDVELFKFHLSPSNP